MVNEKTQIGKIRSVRFGFGGYQNAQFGITIVLGSDTDSWAVTDFRGFWADRPNNANWTERYQVSYLGETVLWIKELLGSVKKMSVSDLVGTPIQATFEGNCLREWRVLTEAL